MCRDIFWSRRARREGEGGYNRWNLIEVQAIDEQQKQSTNVACVPRGILTSSIPIDNHTSLMWLQTITNAAKYVSNDVSVEVGLLPIP